MKGERRASSALWKLGAGVLCLHLVCLALARPAQAEDAGSAPPSGDAEPAQELSNPAADRITFPVQMNHDRGIGPRDDGWRLQTNIQPVIPFPVNEDWNLIARTIVPVIRQDDIFPGAGSQCGLGDINMGFFFSPQEPTSGGVIWGAGPSMAALTVRGPWTVGVLANHVWPYAGDSDRRDISNTFVQRFVACAWPNAWTASVQSEATCNWKTRKWSVPLDVALSRLVRWGRLPVSLQGGAGYRAEAPDGGPEDFRFRRQASFVLPK